MTHEFKNIIDVYAQAVLLGQKAVLATLVAVEGSSYRKEGVRMLVLENGKTVGAVSGGCVEKEIIKQSQSVFISGVSKMMTYNGRFRLGCEGTLYLLLEELKISENIQAKIQHCFTCRKTFELKSFYNLNENSKNLGTVVMFNDGDFGFLSKPVKEDESLFFYHQKMNSCFQVYILGTEHDAQDLSLLASNLGWEVIIIAPINSQKKIDSFSGATDFLNMESEEVGELIMDEETAVVVMTHNYAKDLSYLRILKNKNPVYIGLLGAIKRKEQLLSALIEEDFDIKEQFLNKIHGPAGLNIGAVTPQEIAISILAEIISVVKEKNSVCLKDVITSKNFV